jgi:hypothetical protein
MFNFEFIFRVLDLLLEIHAIFKFEIVNPKFDITTTPLFSMV